MDRPTDSTTQLTTTLKTLAKLCEVVGRINAGGDPLIKTTSILHDFFAQVQEVGPATDGMRKFLDLLPRDEVAKLRRLSAKRTVQLSLLERDIRRFTARIARNRRCLARLTEYLDSLVAYVPLATAPGAVKEHERAELERVKPGSPATP
jgi:hypothetical protein